tara:strand:+ start:667 stop:3123 length:2457 start_codon:yes stop_codon:yes gene_type:complete
MTQAFFLFLLISFLGLSSIHSINAQVEDSESEIAIPDIVINFEDNENWYGLESDSNPYWKIEDGVGKFYLISDTLNSGERQLESASIDFEKLLGKEIGEDWVLRYKLTFDEFKQGKDSSWSQLLIGLFSKPTPSGQSDITHGDITQWGLGAAYMTGVDMTRTMLMYDLGFYVQWHSEPEKGQFEREKSLPETDKTIWVEYRKMKSFLTVSIFSDEGYERETLIERQYTEGWNNVKDLQYFRIFPLIETNTSDGIITGTIDDIEFYNNKRYVIKNFDEDELEEMKTFEERLEELFGKQNQVKIQTEKNRLEQLKKESIPDWLKFPTELWADSNLSNQEFFLIIEYLIKQDILATPLSDYSLFEEIFKPQTIKIPEDSECITCIETDLINLRWVIPEELDKKGSSSQIIIHSPDGTISELTSLSNNSAIFEITSESVLGIYNVDVKYANEKFQAPSFLLTNDSIPKLPFWIKQDAKMWSNDTKPVNEFKDILSYLIKEKFIDLEPSDYIVPTQPITLTEKQILLTYFPNDDERKEFEPFTWKYFDNYARGIFQYRAAESMLIQSSVGKILFDNSRPYEPIYNERQVPYILMELYKYESNEDARTFVDKYPRVYSAFFKQSDMSGTSEETGDCMYNYQKNVVPASQDEIHMMICIYNDLAILITVYEDYPIVNSSLIFKVADVMFKKIHDGQAEPKLDEILQQNIFEDLSTNNQLSQKSQPPPEQQDPELSGAKVGIQNFSCVKDDFGFVEINGEFANGEMAYKKIVFSIILESYDGTKLAQGNSEILNVQPFEIRKFDGHVQLEQPFFDCSAVINWEKSE